MKYRIYVPEVKLNPGVSHRMTWCDDHVGYQYQDWDVNPIDIPTREGMSIFVFAREEDAIVFSLKWVGVEV